jgi:P27 family predicted phage terminase small subunit
MPGPPPKPTAVKIAEGNPGKRRLNTKEPEPELGEPSMPRHLCPVARKEWQTIVPELLKLGVLTVIDRAALAAYCESFALWESARREVRKNGITFTTKSVIKDEVIVTGIKRNPAVAIANEALRMMKSYLVEFGLTPASRSRLSVEQPPKEDDPVASFFKAAASANSVGGAAN